MKEEKFKKYRSWCWSDLIYLIERYKSIYGETKALKELNIIAKYVYHREEYYAGLL